MFSLLQKILNSQFVARVINFALAYRHRFFVVVLCGVAMYLFVILLSYDKADPAWSHSVAFSNARAVEIVNLGGQTGAWLADVLYTLFGYGAWLVFLWLALEMMVLTLAAQQKPRILLPIRLFAYGFAWLCFVAVLAGASLLMSGVGLDVGGVIGYGLYVALADLLSGVGAIAFAVIGFLVVVGLLVDLKSLMDENATPLPPLQRVLAAVKPVFSEEKPELSKEPSRAYRGVFKEFLETSNIGEKLDDDWEQLTQNAPKRPIYPELKPLASHKKTSDKPTVQNPAQNLADEPTEPNTPAEKTGWVSRQLARLSEVIKDNDKPKAERLKTEQLKPETPTVQPTLPKTSVEQADKPILPPPASNISVMANARSKEAIKEAFAGVDFSYLSKVSKSAVPNPEPKIEPRAESRFEPQPHFVPTVEPKTEPRVEPQVAQRIEPIAPINPTPVAPPTPEVSRPDIHDDGAFETRSFAMQTAAYRANLTPIPSLDLLDPKPFQNFGYSQAELHKLAELLEIKLKEFGVNATVMDVVQGPVVTSFEVQLAAGVKASKVTNISQDLARSLSMTSLRVVEVIAGKPYIGIEIPNQSKEIVKLTELLNTPDYQQGDHQIAMAMGKDIGGNVVIADLAKAPHMLVAGTTGSGKSVLVNAMLLSMLLKYTPEELRLILIDPKMLELANYGDIPHLLTPVVTDMTEAASALSWCVGEMERRYQLMALLKVRKISEFNKKIKEAENRGQPILDPLWRKLDSVSQDKPPKLKPLPLIVVVADEFADMIMQVGKQAEELITRLAQKSRAAGIHLMLATQRPSVDVITGLIKANIPSRAALRVNSKVDSRTILDAGGAEDMLGHGDMLFLAPGKNEPIRVHGAYVTDEEVNRVTDAWRERGAPDYIDTVTSSTEYLDVPKGDGVDALYDEALAFVMDSGKTSISAVQRRLSVGYNRAANIIEQLEQQGVLSKPDNSGKRTLLI